MVNQNQRSDEISHVKRENEMYPKFLDEPDPKVILKKKHYLHTLFSCHVPYAEFRLLLKRTLDKTRLIVCSHFNKVSVF